MLGAGLGFILSCVCVYVETCTICFRDIYTLPPFQITSIIIIIIIDNILHSPSLPHFERPLCRTRRPRPRPAIHDKRVDNCEPRPGVSITGEESNYSAPQGRVAQLVERSLSMILGSSDGDPGGSAKGPGFDSQPVH